MLSCSNWKERETENVENIERKEPTSDRIISRETEEQRA